jgi:hypothetical protein
MIYFVACAWLAVLLVLAVWMLWKRPYGPYRFRSRFYKPKKKKSNRENLLDEDAG